MNKEDYTEERSGIQGLFTEAMAKVLDFLLAFEGFDYSKDEIARNSEIDYESLYNLWEKLEYYDIVKKTENTGNTMLFTLNTESPIVKALKKLQIEVIFYEADKIVQEQTEESIMCEGIKEKVKVV
jgi:hypothetical protein